ncbi:TadE family type IV pilus minor pilin [Cellulomonas sp. ICMP 17802]|uniref:TadE family type IV pilus minor pilin n=1 Tax=Cellulomonas sp. ICMP 17802 TaxID=3239199 RepID=UPI00351AEC13
MSPAGRRDRGSVTAELAAGLPAVVLLVAALLTVASAAISQTRCADGARAGARAAALGEPDGTVTVTARHVAGDRAAVAVSRAGGWVTVDVSVPVGSWQGSPLRAHASAVATVEP